MNVIDAARRLGDHGANLSRCDTYNGWLSGGMDSGSDAGINSHGDPRRIEFPKTAEAFQRHKEVNRRGPSRSIESLRLPSRVIAVNRRWDSHRCCKRHGTIL